MEKNFKKAAVNPFVKANSGGIILKGMNVGYSTEAPTFNVVIAAGGNSSTFTLNSGNFAQFEFVRYNITDSAGNGNGAVYASGTETLNITTVSKAYNGIGPDASIEIVYKLVGQEQVLSYSINLDSASLVAGITVNTADALTLDLNTADYAAGTTAALTLDFFDTIRVKNVGQDGTVIDKTLQCMGVVHEITPGTWNTTFVTSEPIIDSFIIGSSLYGIIGTSVMTY